MRLSANKEFPRRRKLVYALEVYRAHADELRYQRPKVRFHDGHVVGERIFMNPEHLTPAEFANDFRLVAADNGVAAVWMLDRARGAQLITLRRTDLLPLLVHTNEPNRGAAIRALARVVKGGRRKPGRDR